MVPLHERSGWSRRYPPLLLVVAALALAMFALPSALNLPQANPGQTLEYAPVPGDASSNSSGNFAGLGLGSGGAAGSIGEAPGVSPLSTLAPLAPPPQGAGGVPATKQCVGNPPRQTEDPLSPPCVAYFRGDNGGATYHGVTRTEVRLLFYFDCCVQWANTSQGTETMPTNKYFDLGVPAQGTEPVFVRDLRTYEKFFNGRYQTYNRELHFYAYFGSPPPNSNTQTVSPDARRADAADNLRTVQPYAIENFATSNSQAYVEAMAANGVPSFGFSALGPGVFAGHPEAYFARYPKMIWDYLPSLEHQAAIVSSWVCQKIVPNPVSFAGDSTMLGKPRQLALLHTTDPGFPEIQAYAQVLKQDITACGGKFVADGTFPNACCGVSADYQNSVQNEADFKRKGVTTVIWGGGLESTDPQAATATNYRPEWILAGDRGLESFGNAQVADQSQWQHAWVISNLVRVGPFSGEPCYLALASENPATPPSSSGDVGLACSMYDEVRELITGSRLPAPVCRPTPWTRDSMPFRMSAATTRGSPPASTKRGITRVSRMGRRCTGTRPARHPTVLRRVVGGWPKGVSGTSRAPGHRANRTARRARATRAMGSRGSSPAPERSSPSGPSR